MSRSGYSDDCEYLELYRWNVDRTIRGKVGQAFLKELAAAMDAMPVKELIAHELVAESGACCAIGSVCKARGIDTSDIFADCPDSVGKAVGISRLLAAEIEFMNDEWSPGESPEERWGRMRKWVAQHIKNETEINQ
jgi:hypothetical protein